MNKYDALLMFHKTYYNEYEEKETPFYHVIENFEIAWESGQFDDEAKGECCT